ncbi:hypothetical protein F2Q69_00019793 [Brassica cretica]|uniref:Uncharacterized protein n=1 Tax=Brassica cretica TaxID=69181 RepID=A0A8S9QC98_BRACR|nr:hypothetical protein F2Q69_00019793 [Brassica cretica]
MRATSNYSRDEGEINNTAREVLKRGRRSLFVVPADFFSGNLDLWCSGFLSGINGFDSVVWPAYVLVSPILRPAFGCRAHAFLFGVDCRLLALGFDGGGLYRMLLVLLFFVPSLFQLIPALIGSTTVFNWNSIGSGVRFWL